MRDTNCSLGTTAKKILALRITIIYINNNIVFKYLHCALLALRIYNWRLFSVALTLAHVLLGAAVTKI